MNIDWKRKLTSRKFWMAIASFVSMLVVAFGGSDAVASQVTALILAGATVIAYIIGEGMTDAAGAGRGDGAEKDSQAYEDAYDDPGGMTD